MVEFKDWMSDLARDRDTIGSSLDNISQPDRHRGGLPAPRPATAQGGHRRAARACPSLLNKPENRKNLAESARPDAGDDDRPDPDRHLRLVVPVLRLWCLRAHQARRSSASRPCSSKSTKYIERLLVQVHRAEVPEVMARPTDARILRLGVITLVVMALVSAATFNLGKFPGFRGTTYYAEFSDASGIHKGNIVQVGGIRVGRVTDVALAGDRVKVKFELKGDVEFGKESKASIKVLNLLGEKFLDVQPEGSGQASPPAARSRSSGPRRRTTSSGCSPTSPTPPSRSTPASLSTALDTVADTLDVSAPEIRASFDGIARLSRSVASRDAEIQSLFESPKSVSKVLSERSQDIVSLMKNSDLVFKELTKRRDAVHALLVNARTLAVEPAGTGQGQREADRAGPAGGRRTGLLPGVEEAEDQGDAGRARPLCLHPQQHHRHRPVVRRLRVQPARPAHR
ncbi:MlaD family protein [Nocardioides convexus]|uniref:MlaD family protein n=1 Tax=Nocardioides convexus TaxID=2712224 RepID=UPI002418B427|nr:MlaD family protein [Nocardioides convexus]